MPVKNSAPEEGLFAGMACCYRVGQCYACRNNDNERKLAVL